MIEIDAPATPRCADVAQLAVQAIADRGYALVTEFVSPLMLAELQIEFDRLYRQGVFRRAGIGAGSDLRTRDDIRGDEIFWIEPEHATPPLRAALDVFDLLRMALNRVLYLGLFEFECHLAQFAPGSGYQRHYDQFRRDARRQVTVTLYLNDHWENHDGGILRLYRDDAENAETVDILPIGGSMIAFLSARFPHEVLPCSRRRRSLTGWFKTRA